MSEAFAFPPALIMLVGALVIALCKRPVANWAVLVTPVLTLAAVLAVPDGVSLTMTFLSYPIEPVEGAPVRRLFGTVFAVMAFAGGLYAYKTASRTELAAAFAYAGGAVGVAFAGDLITLFLFWEMMALFSTVVVWCGGTARSRAAGIRYAIMHLLGGIILKVGIEGVFIHTGSLDIAAMHADNFDTWMILIGLLINAAAPPVSAWLADAYPETSPTGMVFLSAFTTKTAVLALILLFPGEPMLIWIGLYMAFYGIIYALLENDARRILAYSIVNQVGFMVCGIGIGTEMAINGAAAHAFAHIIYKALLLMSAGAVLYRTGKSKCTDLGGLFRTMPVTCTAGIIGALAISSFPLTSGYTTKTMISEAAGLEHMGVVYFLLAAASAGVFLHAGIKFPWFVFFQKDSGLRPKDAPPNMAAAMIFFSVLCIYFGLEPSLIYSMLPYPVDFHPYTGYKLVFYLQLLLFSGLAFFLMLPWLKRTETISLDTDWLWRSGGKAIAVHVTEAFAKARAEAETGVKGELAKARGKVISMVGEEGLLARPWAIRTTALWVVILLSGYALVYYL